MCFRCSKMVAGVALALTSQLKFQHEREKDSARLDNLTGIANQKGFYEALSV